MCKPSDVASGHIHDKTHEGGYIVNQQQEAFDMKLLARRGGIRKRRKKGKKKNVELQRRWVRQTDGNRSTCGGWGAEISGTDRLWVHVIFAAGARELDQVGYGLAEAEKERDRESENRVTEWEGLSRSCSRHAKQIKTGARQDEAPSHVWLNPRTWRQRGDKSRGVTIKGGGQAEWEGVGEGGSRRWWWWGGTQAGAKSFGVENKSYGGLTGRKNETKNKRGVRWRIHVAQPSEELKGPKVPPACLLVLCSPPRSALCSSL